MILHLECTPDEIIAMFLGKTRKQIRHHNDKGRVCNHLSESNSCLAMIDQDPGSAQPTYLTSLKLAKPEQFGIKLLSDELRNHKVIVVCPRLEDWLIYVCQEANVDITRLGLSNKPSILHREINSRLNRLKELLERLEDAQAKPLEYLRALLK